MDVKVFSIFCDERFGKDTAFKYANIEIDSLYAIAARNRDKMMMVATSSELQQALHEKKLACMMGVEGGHMIEDKLSYLDSFYKRGVTVPLEAIAGLYLHPVYGRMQVAIKDRKAVATFEHHKGRYATVEPLGGNRYLAQFNDPLYGNKVWPVSISNSKVKSVTVTVADFVEFTPYEFVKTN